MMADGNRRTASSVVSGVDVLIERRKQETGSTVFRCYCNIGAWQDGASLGRIGIGVVRFECDLDPQTGGDRL